MPCPSSPLWTRRSGAVPALVFKSMSSVEDIYLPYSVQYCVHPKGQGPQDSSETPPLCASPVIGTSLAETRATHNTGTPLDRVAMEGRKVSYGK